MSQSFHEVVFPMSIALGTSGGPERRNDIVLLSNGYESRNARWKNARRRYDAGSGMRSIDDLYKLVEFFEARQGSLYGFRFKDPLDFSSAGISQTISANDQIIGTGDGATLSFQLIKTYQDIGGATERVIKKPVSGSVLVTLDGMAVSSQDISVDYTNGEITFNTAPQTGVVISAGYEFHVPVRFELERLDVNLSAFNAGHVPTVPLVEIKP